MKQAISKQEATTKRVALLIETSNAYARGVLRGIRSYVEARAQWSLFLGEHRRGEALPAWLRDWQGDGIIARIETRAIAEHLVERGLPTVDVSAARHTPELPYVETDDSAFAAMAADHLIGRGFQHLAFSGDRGFMWSNNRRDGFCAHVAASNREVFIHETNGRKRNFATERKRLVHWLQHLPKPVGIMGCYDIRGRELLNACREAGIAVPFEVAVVGVDNDELICELAEPRLSSVIPNVHRTGYEAAALLDRMMSGEHVPPGAYLIPPLGVATRQSSDMLAIDDPEIAKALQFIRQHACEGIKVEDILETLPLSRRIFESRFKQLTARTPHEEILRVQIDRVKQLLTQTDMSHEAIAHRCGFRHAEYMSVAFKRVVGMPPGRFRDAGRPS